MKKIANKPILLTLLCFILFYFVISIGITNSSGAIQQEEKELYIQTIRNAALNCYGIEGFYPADIQYLVDNYGLIINPNYSVFYETVGSNMMPVIKVVG